MNASSAAWTVFGETLSLARGAKRILDGVTVGARAGEFVGVVGPNGAGKSTLLRMLASLLQPQAGVVFIDGRDTRRQSPRDVARFVASVPQDTSIDFSFTAREIVAMGRHPHLGRFGAAGERDAAAVTDAVGQTGIEVFADRRVTSLSGGERQLVFIAKALAQEPRVLLLDEPVAALDIRHQLDVLLLVHRQVARGLSAVAVLHDLNLAARFCHRLVLLAEGQVVAMGTPSVVMTDAALGAAYRVRTIVRTDPDTGALNVTALAPLES